MAENYPVSYSCFVGLPSGSPKALGPAVIPWAGQQSPHQSVLYLKSNLNPTFTYSKYMKLHPLPNVSHYQPLSHIIDKHSNAYGRLSFLGTCIQAVKGISVLQYTE